MLKLTMKFNPVCVIYGYENGFWFDELVFKKEFLNNNTLFSLKELRNYNRKLFLCPPHNQDSKLLFFKINLHFGTSD